MSRAVRDAIRMVMDQLRGRKLNTLLPRSLFNRKKKVGKSRLRIVSILITLLTAWDRYVLFGGTISPGPILTAMCYNARGNGTC